VQAQVVPGNGPTKTQCGTAAQAFEANPHNSGALETLPACGKMGGRPLARAFHTARFETSGTELERFYAALGSMRDPEVFASALSVMQDPAATPQARATAILIAMAQHDNALSPPIDVSFSDLITFSNSSKCRLLDATDASYRSVSPLPDDYLQQLRLAIQGLLGSPDTPTVVRAFADCAKSALAETQSVKPEPRS
jgi:hypothetical protein